MISCNVIAGQKQQKMAPDDHYLPGSFIADTRPLVYKERLWLKMVFRGAFLAFFREGLISAFFSVL